MAPESDIITVEIRGTRLQLRGGDNPEAVRQAGEFVRERVEELAERAPNAPLTQLALLVAMNLANDLLQQSSDEEDAIKAAAEKADRILRKTNAAMR